MRTRSEMLDLVTENNKAKGIIVRNLVTGELTKHAAHAVVLATGGYSRVFRLSTLAMACNGSAIWKAHKKGALFSNPSFTQIHPTALPQRDEAQSKLTLMSESLRNDGRIWVPKNSNDTRKANDIPEDERDYYLERKYPSFGNLAPRDISSRAAKEAIDKGLGVGPLNNAVYLDFKQAIAKLGKKVIQDRYGNLFDMYEKITGINAYKEPMLISPAAHFSMGGLWVDYELMTSIDGLYAIGECNYSDHGANRLGANSLLQASVDGYFILPNTINNYLANEISTKPETSDQCFEKSLENVKSRITELFSIKGSLSADEIHRRLGRLMWNNCAMSRNKSDLEKAISEIQDLRDNFNTDLALSGKSDEMNTELEKALRVSDFIEMAELMCIDALQRDESCGAHFRTEHQTSDGEAVRNDEEFSYVSCWQYGTEFKLHKENLEFEYIKPSTRSYK